MGTWANRPHASYDMACAAMRTAQRGVKMTKVGESYVCDICGNEVSVVKAGGGTLVCCGVKMRMKE